MNTLLKSLILAFLCGITFSSRAEYNGWYMNYEITTIEDQKINAYCYVASAYFNPDSIENIPYLIRTLDVLDYNGHSMLSYYKNRISYYYMSYGSNDTSIIYTMVNKDSISKELVKSIKVNGMIPYTYLIGISTTHVLADTVWMKQAVSQMLMVSGYLCDWQVFIHDVDKTTAKVLMEIDEYETKHDANIRDLAEGYEGHEFDIPPDIQQQIEKLEERQDEDKANILKELKNTKTVIVGFCSC